MEYSNEHAWQVSRVHCCKMQIALTFALHSTISMSRKVAGRSTIYKLKDSINRCYIFCKTCLKRNSKNITKISYLRLVRGLN